MSVPTELWEQQTLIEWMRLKRLTFFAIPNGGKRTRWQAQQAKREGMTAGAPDLAVILPKGVTLWVEMKRRKGGRVSPGQKVIGNRLQNLEHHYRVCKGWEEAKEWIETKLEEIA